MGLMMQRRRASAKPAQTRGRRRHICIYAQGGNQCNLGRRDTALASQSSATSWRPRWRLEMSVATRWRGANEIRSMGAHTRTLLLAPSGATATTATTTAAAVAAAGAAGATARCSIYDHQAGYLCAADSNCCDDSSWRRQCSSGDGVREQLRIVRRPARRRRPAARRVITAGCRLN